VRQNETTTRVAFRVPQILREGSKRPVAVACSRGSNTSCLLSRWSALLVATKESRHRSSGIPGAGSGFDMAVRHVILRGQFPHFFQNTCGQGFARLFKVDLPRVSCL
jgi:hypothetical protein